MPSRYLAWAGTPVIIIKSHFGPTAYLARHKSKDDLMSSESESQSLAAKEERGPSGEWGLSVAGLLEGS